MSHLEQEAQRKNDLSNVANKFILTTMILFFIIAVVILFLYIYVGCIIRRQSIRRAAILQLSTGTISVVHAHQPPETHGLDKMVIARLPIFLYKKPDVVVQQTDGKAVNNPVEECSVCLSFLEEEEIVRALPNCNHMFHAKCIDMWLMTNSTCPICRTEAQPRVLEPSSSEDDQSKDIYVTVLMGCFSLEENKMPDGT